MDYISKNLEIFRYCPQCGQAALRLVSSKVLVCSACSFEFYFNSATAVGALIRDEQGRLLVTVRKDEPCKGMWDLPGGFVDANESAEEAVVREIKEEIDLDVINLEYFCSFANTYEYKGFTYCTCDISFVCEVADISKAKALDDVAEILFLSDVEIELGKFGFESVRKIVGGYLAVNKKG